MKITFFVFALFIATGLLSQEKFISIYNPVSDKTAVFKDNARVRVKTSDGGKLSGKLHIQDDINVMINNISIPVTSIEKIKLNPLFLNVLISGTLIIMSAYSFLAGLVVAVWGGAGLGVALIGSSVGFAVAGILSPNFLPAVTVDSGSTVKIVNKLE